MQMVIKTNRDMIEYISFEKNLLIKKWKKYLSPTAKATGTQNSTILNALRKKPKSWNVFIGGVTRYVRKSKTL